VRTAALFLCVVVAACGLFPEPKEITANWTAEEFYKNAHDALVEGNYSRAITLFDGLEGRYPYGRIAQQAILESAYANYRQGEPTTALAACDRFIRTYPNHPNVDYAYYLKGLINFREDQGFVGYLADQDLSERDPKLTRESFASFRELATRFPDSKYTPDAIERMRYLTNALGGYEVHVARYYFNRGAYVAAVNRAQASIVNFPKTPANEDALILMVESYDRLGMLQLRDDSLRVLKESFPQGKYFNKAAVPWWKFWAKSDLPPPRMETAPAPAKPWWQFGNVTPGDPPR
jgi:outer membrane protein assembly factor BamD